MDENFLTRVTQVADPSYMQPSAPRPVQQYQPPQERKRMSTVDVIGGLLDTFAELGGSRPMYRATLDAQLQREREAELYPLEVQKAQLGNQKTQMDIQSGQNEILGQAASYMQRAYQNGGAQGALNMFDAIAPRIGMTPEQIQGERAQLGANPEGYIGALSVFMGGGNAKTYEVGDSLVRDNGDGTTEVIYSGPAKAPKVRQVQMVGPDGAGIYNIDESGNILGKAGDIARAPTQPRQPTVADQKYQYLVDQGVPEPRARAIALGLEPTAPTGKADAKAVKQQADIKRAGTRLTAMMNSPEFQSGYGLEALAGKAANTLAGAVSNTWQPAPEVASKEAQLAALKQVVKEALTQGRVDSNKDWQRIEPLWPNMSMNAAQQRARMAEIQAILDEISTGVPANNAPPPADNAQPAAPPSVSNW